MTTYKPEDVQMQVFCDNSCTEWMPNGQQLLALNDQELAQNVRHYIQRAVLIRQVGDSGDDTRFETPEEWSEFYDRLDKDFPIKVKGG